LICSGRIGHWVVVESFMGMAIFCCWSSLVLLLTVIAALVGVTVIVGGVQTSCWDELEFAASTSILPKLSLHHHRHQQQQQQQVRLLPCSIEVMILLYFTFSFAC
jgi:hypothetical protein